MGDPTVMDIDFLGSGLLTDCLRPTVRQAATHAVSGLKRSCLSILCMMHHIEDAMAHYWPFVGGIHWLPVDHHHKEPTIADFCDNFIENW